MKNFASSLYARVLLLTLLLNSSPALACAVCGFSKKESQWAFIVTTGILTIIPLMFIGGVVYFFYRQMKKPIYDE